MTPLTSFLWNSHITSELPYHATGYFHRGTSERALQREHPWSSRTNQCQITVKDQRGRTEMKEGGWGWWRWKDRGRQRGDSRVRERERWSDREKERKKAVVKGEKEREMCSNRRRETEGECLTVPCDFWSQDCCTMLSKGHAHARHMTGG